MDSSEKIMDLLQETMEISEIDLGTALNEAIAVLEYTPSYSILQEVTTSTNNDSIVLQNIEIDYSSMYDETELNVLEEKINGFTKNCEDIKKIYDSYVKATTMFMQLREVPSPSGYSEDRTMIQHKQQDIINALKQEIFSYKEFVQEMKTTYENLYQFHETLGMRSSLDTLSVNEKSSDKDKENHDLHQHINGQSQLKSCIVRLKRIFKVAVQTDLNVNTVEQYFKLVYTEYKFDTDLQKQIHLIIEQILQDSLWVLKQPPRVIQTKRAFEVFAALVCVDNVTENIGKPRVKLSILSEKRLEQFMTIFKSGLKGTYGIQQFIDGDMPMKKKNRPNDPAPWSGAGLILNNDKDMKYSTEFDHTVVHMKNIQIIQIKRDKRGIIPVSEDKLGFLYQINIKVNNNSYTIVAHSNATIVTVHHNQDVHARATIFWDNAFTNINRIPFRTNSVMKWSTLKYLLDNLVKTKTGKTGLSEYNMQTLYKKITKTNEPENDEKEITFNDFCRNSVVDGRNITFWEWFDKALALLEKYFMKQWNDGHIVGFANKQEVTETMEFAPPGTFLIRFTDTHLGSISIVYTSNHLISQNKYVVTHLSPIDSKRLDVRDLNMLLHDFNNLTCVLSSGVCKSHAFPVKVTVIREQGYTPIDNPVLLSRFK